jgi:hypothetical protein
MVEMASEFPSFRRGNGIECKFAADLFHLGFFSNAPWSNPLFQPTIHILYPLPTHSLNTYFPFPSVPLSPQTQAQEKQHMNHIYRDISILFSSYLLITVPYFVGSFKSQFSSSRHAATSSLKMTCLLILLLILVVPLLLVVF